MSTITQNRTALEAPTVAESDLPEGWVSVPLHEVATHTKGKKPEKVSENSWPGAIPYIDIEAFETGRMRRFADTETAVVVNKGEVVVVWDGARSGLAGKVPIKGALGSTLARIEPELIDSEYLFHFLKSSFETINSSPRGTGIPHVDPGLFWNLSFPASPIPEQERIAAKIETLCTQVSAARDRLTKVPKILKRFRQSVLAAACSGRLTEDWRETNFTKETGEKLLERLLVERKNNWSQHHKHKGYREPDTLIEDDLPDLPDQWCWASFDQCSLDITVGHVGPMKDRYVEKGLPFLRSQNVRPLRFDPKGLVQIPISFHKELSKSRLLGGEILVVRSGANTGDTCVYPLNSPESNCADLVITRPLSGLSAGYGAIYIASPEGQQRLSFRQTGIAQPHFNIGEMRKKPVPLPPLKEQREIVRRVEALFKLADMIEKRVEGSTKRADKLTQAILAKAFRGELVPTEAELARREGRPYEPASVLLERIKQERKKSTQTPNGKPRPRRHAVAGRS